MKVTGFGACDHLVFGAPGIASSLYGWQECAMLAKCTNLECSKAFRFLHQGKVFRLSPTPDLRKVSATASRSKPEIMTRRTRVRAISAGR